MLNPNLRRRGGGRDRSIGDATRGQGRESRRRGGGRGRGDGESSTKVVRHAAVGFGLEKRQGAFTIGLRCVREAFRVEVLRAQQRGRLGGDDGAGGCFFCFFLLSSCAQTDRQADRQPTAAAASGSCSPSLKLMSLFFYVRMHACPEVMSAVYVRPAFVIIPPCSVFGVYTYRGRGSEGGSLIERLLCQSAAR